MAGDQHAAWRFLADLSRTQRYALFAVGLLVVFGLPLLGSGYLTAVGFSILLFVSLGLGWNFLSGFTGYVNFGYSTFVGIGAYVTVLLLVDASMPWPVALLVGAVATAVIGVLLGLPMLRLRGAYFAIAMLAASVAVRIFVSTNLLTPITRGGTGISFLSDLDYTGQYYVLAVLTVLVLYLTYRIATSPFGLRLLAIREDELLASALGVKTTREKLVAMALHAGVAGLVGGMLAFQLSYIDPKTVFAMRWTEYPIIMVLFGSLGTVVGPVVGGIVVSILDELLWANFPSLHQGFLGIVIVLLVLYMPEGVVEWLKENDYIPRRRSI